ncbi:MAG TPA: DoxX family protein [Bacteroidia bacterium]|nr:DoxX family protein [Bacteroidia bacterium]
MKEKIKKIVYWVLTGLLAFLFGSSSLGKLFSSPEALKMAEAFGLTGQTYMMLGIIELVSVILFVIPRTGVLGSLLLIAYMGGAIATHLEHGQPVIAPCVIQAVLWLIVIFRFPELRERLFKGNA